MKEKRLSLATAAVLAAGGMWFAWSAYRTEEFQKSNMDGSSKTPHGATLDPSSGPSLSSSTQRSPARITNDGPNPGEMVNSPAQLAPPEPNRRFTDFTPEQRVEFARQGHGPGG